MLLKDTLRMQGMDLTWNDLGYSPEEINKASWGSLYQAKPPPEMEHVFNSSTSYDDQSKSVASSFTSSSPPKQTLSSSPPKQAFVSSSPPKQTFTSSSPPKSASVVQSSQRGKAPTKVWGHNTPASVKSSTSTSVGETKYEPGVEAERSRQWSRPRDEVGVEVIKSKVVNR